VTEHLAAVKRSDVTRREKDLLPWRRAEQLKPCFLYWAPVNQFPVPVHQKKWLLEFFNRLTQQLQASRGLRPELFLQFKSLLDPQLKKKFLNHAADLCPITGLSRRPGAPLQQPPDPEDVKAIIEGRKEFVFGDYVADYAYWFVDKSAEKQRELFLGEGGLTMLYLKPDPATQAPPVPFSAAVRKRPIFQKFDVDRLFARTIALRDGFQEKSKNLFGSGLEDDPQFAGLRFVIPLLTTGDFFCRPPQDVESWFQLFDVYVNESHADNGILMAFKEDYENSVIELLAAMRKDNLEYVA
jgi:hypothetical protein